jgi:diguanylate cyclase (GGDEF)-like protein
MIDIDRFKLYNDTYGHLMGDEVLRKVANVLELNLRRADVLCRYGGEEFVVILPEINAEQACLVAEKLRTAVIDVDFAGEEKMPSHQVTISIGVSAFPESGDTEQDVLQKADDALYRAKNTGRNRVVMLQPGEE